MSVMGTYLHDSTDMLVPLLRASSLERANSAGIVIAAFSAVALWFVARYAAGVGMIWGLFLGTAAMAFSLLLITLVHIARVIRKKSDEQNPP